MHFRQAFSENIIGVWTCRFPFPERVPDLSRTWVPGPAGRTCLVRV